MRQLVVVQESDGRRELVTNMTHMVQWIRLIVIVLLFGEYLRNY